VFLLMFQEGKSVYLIFSINGSNHFQGVARMTSPVGQEKVKDFQAAGLGNAFSVEWVKR